MDSWAAQWAGEMGEHYQLNGLRLKNTENFSQYDGRLKQALERMKASCSSQLADETLDTS